jgi:hypothetical protein
MSDDAPWRFEQLDHRSGYLYVRPQDHQVGKQIDELHRTLGFRPDGPVTGVHHATLGTCLRYYCVRDPR